MIEIKNLTKSYPSGITPFKDLNCTINDGDVISVIGPSGCGKSTFIRCINLLEKPTSGSIIIDGVDVTIKSKESTDKLKDVGMVFQSFNLFSHLTILENIMVPQMDILKRSKQEAYDKAISLLNDVGLLNQKFSYPESLSGGQKQRVAIARTLAMDCKYILLDEPTSALDPTMVGEVANIIKKISKKGITMLIVTHEMKFAKNIANRVLFLCDGGIHEDGSPEKIFLNPDSPKTKRFVNQAKLLDLEIKDSNYDILSSMSTVNEFASNCGFSEKIIYKIESCYEELIMNTLFNKIREVEYINISFEYYEKEEMLTMKVSYGGNSYNPTLFDELPIKILKHNVNSINHNYNNENVIELSVSTN